MPEIDPDEDRLAAGYEKVRALRLQIDDLYDAEEDAFGRAISAREAAYPEPEQPAELAVFNKMTVEQIDNVLDPSHPATMRPDLFEA